MKTEDRLKEPRARALVCMGMGRTNGEQATAMLREAIGEPNVFPALPYRQVNNKFQQKKHMNNCNEYQYDFY